MRRLRQRMLLILIVAASLLPSIGFTPSFAAFAAPAVGPDFRLSDSELSHPLRIIVYGDMRFTDPSETLATNPKVRRWLVDQVAAEKPDAVLLSGDVPWHGGNAGDYDVYRSETRIWRDDAPSHLSGARQSRILGPHPRAGLSGKLVERFSRTSRASMVLGAARKIRLYP